MKVSELEDTHNEFDTIYERDYVEELLEDDRIDVQEAAFMRGYTEEDN